MEHVIKCKTAMGKIVRKKIGIRHYYEAQSEIKPYMTAEEGKVIFANCHFYSNYKYY